MTIYNDYDLTCHNTFGISATCRRYIDYDSTEDAIKAGRMISQQPYIIIGGGSNLLLVGNYDGTVVHSSVMGIESDIIGNNVMVKVGSGECWDHLVAHCVEQGWHGLENLSLIPGDTGAAAVQNIGAYGAEVKDYIYKVEGIEVDSGRTVSFGVADCHYAYRDSIFKNELKGKVLITHVTLLLSREFVPNISYGGISTYLTDHGIKHPDARQLRAAIIDIRRIKLPDPEELGNAGSFFKNPVVDKSVYERLKERFGDDMPHYSVDDEHEKIPAGWMIEKCGWKGRRVGNAGVHDRQALVLVNHGGASGQEILALCNSIRSDIKDMFGIDLQPEVNIV